MHKHNEKETRAKLSLIPAGEGYWDYGRLYEGLKESKLESFWLWPPGVLASREEDDLLPGAGEGGGEGGDGQQVHHPLHGRQQQVGDRTYSWRSKQEVRNW